MMVYKEVINQIKYKVYVVQHKHHTTEDNY